MPEALYIKNILIWSKTKSSFIRSEFFIVSNVLACFFLDEDYSTLDLEQIDSSKITEEISDEDSASVKKILDISNIDDYPQPNIADAFKIEVDEGKFYTIKDYQDGNYLSVDK